MFRWLVLTLLVATLLSEAAFAQLTFTVTPERESERMYRVLADGGRREVFAEGDIAVGDTMRLRRFLAENKIDDALIIFNSPGGVLIEGLQLGRMLRELGHDTEVRSRTSARGVCASACAYAFAGGLNRYYSTESGLLGLHQFYGGAPGKNAESQAQEISGLLVAYLTAMGVDALAFSVSTRAGSEEMIWLSEEEAVNLGFANNGVEPTWAELKMSDMRPYLKIEQRRRKGHARVLFFCDKGQVYMTAGVVADPDQSAFHASISIRSYIELDGRELLIQREGGAKAVDSVLWLDRTPSAAAISALLSARTLNIWTEGGGAVRWGGGLDLLPVREKLREYVTACRGAR